MQIVATSVINGNVRSFMVNKGAVSAWGDRFRCPKTRINNGDEENDDEDNKDDDCGHDYDNEDCIMWWTLGEANHFLHSVTPNITK